MNDKFCDTVFGKGACIMIFERYRKSQNMPVAAAAYHDIINGLVGIEVNGKKTLVSDRAARKKIIDEWTEKHTTEMLIVKEDAEKRGYLSQAEGIMEAIASDFKDDKSLQNVLKREFLRHFFNELITQNKDLDI